MRSVKNCPPWIPQKAVSWLIPIPHPWFVKDSALLFRLPGEWQVCSDRPLCRRLGNGQAATLLQSNILLKTCHYRDKISTCYCCAVPFQRLYKAFFAVLGIHGTGLGMAITKNIVDMMGGTIKVQTAQGKGAEFIICLPMRTQTEHRPVKKITEPEGLKALVVEDNELNREIAPEILREYGFRVDAAEN